MTVITGAHDICERMSEADPEDRCVMCDKRLTVPYLSWTASTGKLFICGQCCDWIAHGLTADLRRVVLARAIAREGFREGARRASSNSFLCIGTNNEH